MKKFPTEPLRAGTPGPDSPGPARPADAAGGKKVLTQVVLPLAAFVAVVAGVTFVYQYVPSGTGPADKDSTPGAPPVELLFFPEKMAQWEPKPPGEANPSSANAETYYVKEFDNGSPGRYTFWFENREDRPVELGFTFKNCICSEVDVCLLSEDQARRLQEGRRSQEQLLGTLAFPSPAAQVAAVSLVSQSAGGPRGFGGLAGQDLPWKVLSKEEHKQRGILVQPGEKGLIRLSWDGKKQKNEQTRFHVILWTQPSNRSSARKDVDLFVVAAFWPPVRTTTNEVQITDWDSQGVGRGEFTCWSSTHFDFSLAAKVRDADPCVETEVQPLSAAECREEEAKLSKARGQAPTRFLAGYRVKVAVHEAKGGRQLELGNFVRWIDLFSPQAPELESVQVTGSVRGDVVVGNERGVVNMGSFPASRGQLKSVPVWTNPGVDLQAKIDKKPDFMKVALKQTSPGGANEQTGWRLTVTIPPNPPVGVWPEDSEVILHMVSTKDKDSKPRKIRIPVRANPYQR
jgi:hypothetical protein